MELESKTIIVTVASSGIGAAEAWLAATALWSDHRAVFSPCKAPL